MPQQPSSLGGASLLQALQAQVPVLRRRCLRMLVRIAADLEPLVCNWDVDALAQSLEAVHAATGAIHPGLLSPRRFLKVFSRPASRRAISAFQQSVQQSAIEGEALFGEVSAFQNAQERRMALLRKATVNLRMEINVARNALAARVNELVSFDADMQSRASLAADEASRAAASALLQKAAGVREDLRMAEAACRAGGQLLAACDEALQASAALLSTLGAKIDPAWRAMSLQLQAVKPNADALTRQRAEAVEASRAELHAWLEEAMLHCDRLQRAAEAGSCAIDALRRCDGELVAA